MDPYRAWRRLLRLDHDDADIPELFAEQHQPIRLLVATDEDDFPEAFRDVLKVKILGYRDREVTVDGRRVRLLDPIWTLVPNDA